MPHPVIECLYEVFRPYRLAADFGGCDCCVDPRRSAELASKRLAELTVEDLNSYAFKAMSTWGSDRDFKHFLPRLLELAVVHPHEFLSTEVLLGKLAYADWDTWPRVERDAVSAYLEHLWTETLTAQIESVSDDSADTVLCGVGHTGTDLAPVLDGWLGRSDDNALRHLAAFLTTNSPSVQDKGQLFNSYWSGAPTQSELVVEWLRSDVVRSHIEHADDRLTGDFQEAVWQVQCLQR